MFSVSLVLVPQKWGNVRSDIEFPHRQETLPLGLAWLGWADVCAACFLWSPHETLARQGGATTCGGKLAGNFGTQQKRRHAVRTQVMNGKTRKENRGSSHLASCRVGSGHRTGSAKPPEIPAGGGRKAPAAGLKPKRPITGGPLGFAIPNKRSFAAPVTGSMSTA